MTTILECKQLIKSFSSGDVVTQVLKGIDFKAETGEFVSIMGRSGAGKSTFMYQLSLLDEPTSGEVMVEGKLASSLSPSEKSWFRLVELGYVFQDYALLPELTALENVALPLIMQGKVEADAYHHATESLIRMRLQHRMHNLPSQMSGGEQQRVSIARAVAHKPKILFADEPTANLDNESSQNVMSIFTQLHKEGQTIIMVTHEEQYAHMAQRIVKIDDGKVISDTKLKNSEHRGNNPKANS